MNGHKSLLSVFGGSAIIAKAESFSDVQKELARHARAVDDVQKLHCGVIRIPHGHARTEAHSQLALSDVLSFADPFDGSPRALHRSGFRLVKVASFRSGKARAEGLAQGGEIEASDGEDFNARAGEQLSVLLRQRFCGDRLHASKRAKLAYAENVVRKHFLGQSLHSVAPLVIDLCADIVDQHLLFAFHIFLEKDTVFRERGKEDVKEQADSPFGDVHTVDGEAVVQK